MARPKAGFNILVNEKKNNITYNAEHEREQNIIGKRLLAARKAKKWTLPQLQEVLQAYGVHLEPAAIGKWEKGRSLPNCYQLIALMHILDIQNFDSFTNKGGPLNQEGLRKVEEYKKDLIASGRYTPKKLVPHDNQKEIEYITMPVSSLAVSAGTGCYLDDDLFEKIDFPVSSVPDGADFGVRVSGNSMEPSFHDGQIVWVKKCSSLQPGEVGIFIYDGAGYLKSYDEKIPDASCQDSYESSSGEIRLQPVLVSYNPNYSPINTSPDKYFAIVGKVIRS